MPCICAALAPDRSGPQTWIEPLWWSLVWTPERCRSDVPKGSGTPVWPIRVQ